MNRSLKPKHTQSVNDVTILWFEASNQYSIVDNGLFYCLQLYLEASNHEACLRLYCSNLNLNTEEATTLLKTVEQFLIDLNVPYTPLDKGESPINSNHRTIAKSFSTGKHTFKVYFQSENLVDYIYPFIKHLESEISEPDFWFDVYIENDLLKFYKNDNHIFSYPKGEYHKIQGRFNTELISSKYNKTIEDWLGLFHASSIANEEQTIMLIGKSGSGKSTLSTLLANAGYTLISDDTTAIASKNLNAYYSPLATSIKKGAYSTVEPYYQNFYDLTESHFKYYKGPIKYLPTQEPVKTHLPSNTIVLVNYQAQAETCLEALSIKEALEILIPDSWISPKPENAKAFLSWISTLNYYKLTYSNNDDAILKFRSILPI